MQHIHFAKIDSTNNWAKEHLDRFNQHECTLVTADTQTAGRGRMGKSWISPPGCNLYATYIFFLPEAEIDPIEWVQLLALAAQQILEEEGFPATIKWPNDVLVQGKKIVGILCETVPVSPYVAIVLGIGFNINMQEEVLQTVNQPATSLLALTGREYSVKAIQERLTSALIKLYPQLDA